MTTQSGALLKQNFQNIFSTFSLLIVFTHLAFAAKSLDSQSSVTKNIYSKRQTIRNIISNTPNLERVLNTLNGLKLTQSEKEKIVISPEIIVGALYYLKVEGNPGKTKTNVSIDLNFEILNSGHRSLQVHELTTENALLTYRSGGIIVPSEKIYDQVGSAVLGTIRFGKSHTDYGVLPIKHKYGPRISTEFVNLFELDSQGLNDYFNNKLSVILPNSIPTKIPVTDSEKAEQIAILEGALETLRILTLFPHLEIDANTLQKLKNVHQLGLFQINLQKQDVSFTQELKSKFSRVLFALYYSIKDDINTDLVSSTTSKFEHDSMLLRKALHSFDLYLPLASLGVAIDTNSLFLPYANSIAAHISYRQILNFIEASAGSNNGGNSDYYYGVENYQTQKFEFDRNPLFKLLNTWMRLNSGDSEKMLSLITGIVSSSLYQKMKQGPHDDFQKSFSALIESNEFLMPFLNSKPNAAQLKRFAEVQLNIRVTAIAVLNLLKLETSPDAVLKLLKLITSNTNHTTVNKLDIASAISNILSNPEVLKNITAMIWSPEQLKQLFAMLPIQFDSKTRNYDLNGTENSEIRYKSVRSNLAAEFIKIAATRSFSELLTTSDAIKKIQGNEISQIGLTLTGFSFTAEQIKVLSKLLEINSAFFMSNDLKLSTSKLKQIAKQKALLCNPIF